MAYTRQDVNSVLQGVEEVAGTNAGVNTTLWNFTSIISVGNHQETIYYVVLFFPNEAVGSKWKVAKVTVQNYGSPKRFAPAMFQTADIKPVSAWALCSEALNAVAADIKAGAFDAAPFVTSAVHNIC